MKAVCWHGANDVRVERVPDPTILNPRDAIVKVTSTTICGSDLHIYGGYIPTTRGGDILGHEFMGEVVEVGPGVTRLAVGDRVVVPSTISCGSCFFCQRQEFSLCDNGNPHAKLAEKVFGTSMCGIFGYSHLFGGYAGSFAEYVRVPFADVGPVKVSRDVPEDRLLFLSDAIPTGYMAADLCNIHPGDVVAVWGAGAVGQIAMRSAYLMGASKVIAIDRFGDRLTMATSRCGALPLDYERNDVTAALKDVTAGRGPDACIDAVGMEAHGVGVAYAYDKVKQSVGLEMDRAYVLRQAIYACRKGGTVSVMGVYAGLVDKFPMGVAMNKGLTFRMGQMHGQKYARLLLDRVESGEIDPSYFVTHRMGLEDTPAAFRLFKEKSDGCMRVVLTP